MLDTTQIFKNMPISNEYNCNKIKELVFTLSYYETSKLCISCIELILYQCNLNSFFNIDDIFVKTREHSLVYLLLVDSLVFLPMAEIQVMLG